MENKGIVIGCWAAVAAAGGYMFLGTGQNKADSEKKVEVAMESYLHAFVKGDDKKACDSLTEAARAAVSSMAGTVGAKGCPAAFAKTREIGGPKVIEAARQIKVHKVRINGGTASVELRSGSQDSVAQLEHVGDGWKIASLPKS
jgi:hypothetical protein